MMQSKWAQVSYVQSSLLVCQEHQCIGPMLLYVKMHSCTWKLHKNQRMISFCARGLFMRCPFAYLMAISSRSYVISDHFSLHTNHCEWLANTGL